MISLKLAREINIQEKIEIQTRNKLQIGLFNPFK